MSNLSTTIRNARLAEKTWFNALWFQLVWFLCVIGRDAWLPASLAMLLLHFLLVSSAGRELRNVLPIVALGVVVDSLLSAIGVFDFGGTLIPLWLCALWIAFATTLNRALGVFARRPWLAALVGGLGVPFNYGIGAKLGAVTLPLDSLATGLILIPIWAILLPGLYRLAAAPTEATP